MSRKRVSEAERLRSRVAELERERDEGLRNSHELLARMGNNLTCLRERLATAEARVAELEEDAELLDAMERGLVNIRVSQFAPFWHARDLKGQEYPDDTLRGAIRRAIGKKPK
jgi:hypothetical protein